MYDGTKQARPIWFYVLLDYCIAVNRLVRPGVLPWYMLHESKQCQQNRRNSDHVMTIILKQAMQPRRRALLHGFHHFILVWRRSGTRHSSECIRTTILQKIKIGKSYSLCKAKGSLASYSERRPIGLAYFFRIKY